MKQIPNFITLLNLVFGCLAVIFILQTGQAIVFVEREGFTSVDLPEKIAWGSLFIMAAAVIDFADGFIARMLKANSPMGEQLDSLADAVSFGVAPGLIMYQLLRLSFAREENGLDVSMAWLLPALLIPCAAVWRLAKFNLDFRQEHSFRGLPTPASGLVIACLPLIVFYQQFGLEETVLNKWVLYLFIIALSWLMVSNLPLMGMKFSSYRLRENLPRYLLLVLSLASILVLKWAAAPVILLAYLLVSLAFKNKIA
ncbi:MAG TPA: CDP-alcohol phosphatidyltransferase family protein [Chitinophagaceae bacterium]|nr:CDP-alcohol phosphatidyltransferase family protein [Chitinophagaceae bacterium]